MSKIYRMTNCDSCSKFTTCERIEDDTIIYICGDCKKK